MSAPRPFVDTRARQALDTIAVPLTIAVSVRDRDARLLDFRIDFANTAAATWAGLSRDAMHGRLVTDLIPGLRPAGLFDALAEVVAKGRPFHQHRQPYEGNVEEGSTFAAVFELLAVRLGDGYLSVWAELPDAGGMIDLESIAREAVELIPMVRLESRPMSPSRLRPAT